jgi:iron complex outermembrane receptor protein
MKILARQVCACGVLLLGWALSVQSQTPPPAETPQSEEKKDKPATTYKEEITVTESKERSLTMPSPQAAAEEVRAVAGGAGFVDAEEYKRARVSTLKDALDFSPGVFVQPRFGSDEARLSIRGSGLQRTFHGRGIKLLQDGVPLNLADGSFDMQAVEPLAARYVEVFRGANGLALGSSTLGGAINYVSENGLGARPAQVRTEGGAFGYLRGQVSSGLTHGPLDSYFSLTHAAQDGYRDHAVQSNQRLFGNLGYRLDDDRETRFFVTAVHSDSELPGNLTKAQLDSSPRSAAAGNLALDQQRNFDLYRLANRTTFELGGASRLAVTGFWSYKHLDHPIFQVLDQRSNDIGADVRYENESTLSGRANRLVVGFAPAVGFLEDNRFRNVSGHRGARTAQGDTTSLGIDLYTEDRLALRPGLDLTAGIVASYAGRKFQDDFLTDGDQTDDQTFRGFSPEIGLLLEVTPRTSLFAKVSRSFEPPSFGELTNVGGNGLLQLDAQTATTVEAGSRGTAGAVSWDVVVYHARLDGELLSLNDGAGNPLGTINAHRTLHSGVEAGFEARWGAPDAGIVLRQIYNWSRFVFSGDPVFRDHRLAGMPEHYLRTEILLQRPSGFYGGPNLEWVPNRYPVDHANTLFADPYALVGLKLGYRARSGWAGFVDARNLTDETYAATTGVIADARGLDSAQFLPGDGRSFFAGIEYRW